MSKGYYGSISIWMGCNMTVASCRQMGLTVPPWVVKACHVAAGFAGALVAESPWASLRAALTLFVLSLIMPEVVATDKFQNNVTFFFCGVQLYLFLPHPWAVSLARS
eukprot:gene17753-27330_t